MKYGVYAETVTIGAVLVREEDDFEVAKVYAKDGMDATGVRHWAAPMEDVQHSVTLHEALYSGAY